MTSETSDLSILRDALRVVIIRDLRATEQQVRAYPDDASLWKIAPGIANSGGSLALHMAGNLRHFIGTVLGGGKYVRNRDAEFSSSGMSRVEVAHEIRAAINELSEAFPKIDPTVLTTVYPLAVRNRRLRTADFLLHLAVHLTYHLGQLDYHRRLLTTEPRSVDNLSPLELPEAAI